MLVLTRRKNQKVLFPSLGITVQVVAISGKTVRIGVEAPDDVRIARNELECFDACRVSGSQDAGKNTELVRRQLDAANLAIHLARNQLKQGKSALATDAICHAMACLRSLDLMFDSSDPVSSDVDESVAVRESRSTYRQDSCRQAGSGTIDKPVALAFGSRTVKRRHLIGYLKHPESQEEVACDDDRSCIRTVA